MSPRAGEARRGDTGSKTSARFTKVSDELLRRVDDLQQLLEELVGKALLHGGRVVLQVLQTSATWNDVLRVKLPRKTLELHSQWFPVFRPTKVFLFCL